MALSSSPNKTGGDAVVITGRRMTQGNAVECPVVRSDDGTEHFVFGLTGAIGIGERIRITGHYGITTTCRGEVLIADTLETLTTP